MFISDFRKKIRSVFDVWGNKSDMIALLLESENWLVSGMFCEQQTRVLLLITAQVLYGIQSLVKPNLESAILACWFALAPIFLI